MGYSTQYKGVLKFKEPITVPQLKILNGVLGEDVRDHPDWGKQEFYHVDLELTKGLDGLQWNGTEKSYGLDKQAELVVKFVRMAHPDFAGLVGKIKAQGEDIEDRWEFVMDGADAVRRVLE